VRDQGRWHLTDFQTFLMIFLVVSAIFLGAMAWGWDQPALALVALLLIVAVGLGVFLLGLRYNGRAMVPGMAEVISASPPPSRGFVGKCDMVLAVELPRRGRTTVKIRAEVDVTRWPRPGMQLPIQVTPRGQVRVLWRTVASGRLQPEQAFYEEEAVPGFNAPVIFTEYAEDAFGDDYAGDGGGPTLSGAMVDDEALGPEPDDEPTIHIGPMPEEDEDPPPVTGTRAVELRLYWPDRSDTAVATDDGEARAQAADFEVPARTAPLPRRESGPMTAAPPADGRSPAMGVMLLVSNVGISVAFYRDMLGLSVVAESPESAMLAFPGGRIHLQRHPNMSPVDRRVAHPKIPVADVHEAYQRLTELGVQFSRKPGRDRVAPGLDIITATLLDPDQHAIQLVQEVP
jgi:catechol 2,3-dioxygenase-like lactoylglutathione lyase family enzyme